MKSILVLISILLSAQFILAQEITVIDKVSRQPIPDVTISSLNGNTFVLTDGTGSASLEQFNEGVYLFFQHPAYQDLSLSFQAVKEANYIIALVEEVVNIKEVVVSASRWEQDPVEVPNEIVSVNARQISFQNPQTAADLLQNTGEVFVQKSQQGGGSPMLRGFSANSVLIIVDGIRMNNAIYRSGNLQNVINLDPNVLEGSEVVFGPGSVLYGSDALGGVMDFHTKKPAFTTESKLLTEGSAFVRYSTANQEKTGHVDFNLGGGRFSSLSNITYSSFDDLRAGSNRPEEYPNLGKRDWYVVTERDENGFTDVMVPNENENLQRYSGYNQLNILQKFRYRPADLTDITYSFHYSTTTDIPRYDRLIEQQDPDNPNSPLKYAEWYYGPQKWMLHSLQAGFYQPNAFYNQARFTAGFQQYEESRNDRRFGNPILRNRTEKVNLYTLNADFDKEFGPLSQLFYGLDFAYNFVESDGVARHIDSGETQPIAPRYPDDGSHTYSSAAYASYKYRLGKNLIANVGARYTLYRLTADLSGRYYDFPFQEIELNTSALNGNLGLVYHPQNWKFSTYFSTGFRAPNVDDVAKVFDSEPGTVVVPNPELKPEYTYNFEGSIGYTFPQKLQFSGTAYLTYLQDAMVRRSFRFNGQDSILYDGTMSKVEALVNTNQAIIYGLSASLRVQLLPNLNFNQTISWSDGEDLSDNIPLRHTPPLFGQSSLIYRTKRLKTEFFVRFNGAKEWDELAPSEQNKPHLYTPEGSLAWHTYNLRLMYQLSTKLQLTAGLENIFDKHYRPYSSGISAAGRNLYLNLRAYL